MFATSDLATSWFPRPSYSDLSQAIGFLLLAIAAAAIIARFYLRIRIQRRGLLVSDMLICAAWVSGVVTTSTSFILMHLGALQPDVLLNQENFPGDREAFKAVFKTMWLTQIAFWTTCALSKAALLSMYLQTFPEFMQKRRIFLWATIVYVVLAYIMSIILLLSICVPISTYWDLKPISTCPVGRFQIVFHATSAFNFLGNLLVFALPWFIIPGLNMRRTLKLGVYCTFLLGIIDIGFDMLRFVTIQLSLLTVVVLWTNVDCNISVIIACLPSLRPYFSKPNEGTGEKSDRQVISLTMGEPGGGSKNKHSVRQNLQHGTIECNGFEDERVGEGRRSNASDVELVQLRSRRATWVV
ncbi:hypothetical protein EDB80DRAFT_581816 [Ilyonectria destructans]|nr:hypothetical protein EDB80DRAFT_581816 [Ilyonectria destructans]